jgi:NAD(P)H-nitrite reductase large subunit
MKTVRTKYLIIGNSAGGIGAAEAIRELDKSGSITIISDEAYPTYSRPLISKYITGERSLEQMLFRPAVFYSENDIVSLLGKRVESLELESHSARLDSGQRVLWEKLLLATGGTPIVPTIEGIGKRDVFTFTTFDDAKAIDEFLANAGTAVVIGGGLIGISVTEALVKRGIEVTVIEMKGRILNTILDEQASLIAEEALEQAGVRLITQHTVAEIAGGASTEGVVLDDGERIPCDLVVVAIGVAPRTELVLGTGIDINRGIVIDRHMATNHPDVYSCGDAAEAYDFAYDTNRLTPIWLNAYLGGRIAGYNMAGMQSEYPGSTAMNSLNYFGLDICAAGMVTPPAGEGWEVLSRQNGSNYQMAVVKDNILVGTVFVGDIEKSGIVFGLMRDRVNVGGFKQALLADDFGLASLPREIWQERLQTPPMLVSKPTMPVKAAEDFAGE